MAASSENPRTLPQVARLLRPERRDMGIVLAFSLTVGVLALATPVAVQTLVNFVAFGGLLQPLIVLGVLLFSFLSLASIIRMLSSYLVEMMQRRFFVRAVTELGDQLPHVGGRAYRNGFDQDSVHKFFDIIKVQKAGKTLMLDGLAALLQMVVGLLILGFYHPILFAFDLVLILLIMVVLFALSGNATKTAVAESTVKYRVSGALSEIVAGRHAFKQVELHRVGLERLDLLASDWITVRKQHFRITFRQVVGAFTLQTVAGVGLLTLGGYLVLEEQLTLGQLVAAELIVALALDSFGKFGRKLEDVYDLCASSYKLADLIDTEKERLGGSEMPWLDRGASVELRNVGARYETGGMVLDEFGLSIEANALIAVYGAHGTGKSTLAELVFGSLTPTAGRVEIDGIDLREIDLDSARTQVVLVRDVELLRGSILENVTIWRPGATDSESREVLEAVGLLDELRELPDGLHTQIRSTGSPLTHGQQKRLMFARALCLNPRLLVIDGLLDEIDPPSRERVLQAIRARQGYLTTIVLTASRDVATSIGRVVSLSNPESPDRLPTEVSR